MAKNKFVVIKGVAYPLATAKQQAKLEKPKNNPFKKLKDFMKKQNYDVVKVEDGVSYTRKDGKVLNVKRVSFTNSKTYLVSEKTFWKEL